MPGRLTSPSISTDQVLHQVSEGNIRVDVETTEGGGGSVTVTDAWGVPLAGVTDLPSDPSTTELSRRRDSTELPQLRSDLPRDSEIWDAPDGCGCGGDHDDQDQDVDDDDTCDGTLIPLDEARRQGLLDDSEWLRDAAHSDEALEADREWDDDLDPWRSSSPAKASPAIG